jgi:hypothetical protein
MIAPLFQERQHFRRVWILLMLAVINLFIGYGFISQALFKKSFGNNPASNLELGLLFLFVFSISTFIFLLRLDTLITKEGIYFRFFPVHRAYRKIKWSEIESAYTRTYQPLGEFNGWGIRYGATGKGMAYNVSGNQGLQIVLKNGKKILLGTQQPEVIEVVLKSL